MPSRLRRWLLFCALCAVVGGCGGGAKTEGQSLRNESLLINAAALPAAVVTNQQIAAYPLDSPVHAFLSYWQSLQFQGWSGAVASFDPRYVGFVGEQSLIQAFEALAAYFRAAKPSIYTVKSLGHSLTEIRFVGTSAVARSLGPQSADLQQVSGVWRIEYDSILDQGLLASTEQTAQATIDPAAQIVSEKAIRAGQGAQRLQAAYLASLVSPSPTATIKPPSATAVKKRPGSR